MFSLGNIFGVTLAGFLMTYFFQSYAGMAGERPNPAYAGAFVSAVNHTFFVAAIICLVAIMTSATRRVRIRRRSRMGLND